MKKASIFILLLAIFSVFVFNVFKSYATTPSTLLRASPSDFGLKEGDLISAIFSDDPDVYIINEHGYKRLFLNPEIFKFYAHLGGFTNVKLITPEVRDTFPTVALFRNCEKNDLKVYGFESEGEDQGKLRWVNTSGGQAVQDDPNFFKKVFCINDKEFKWYKRGEELKSVKEVPQYHRAIPAIPATPAVPAIPAIPAIPASLSHPFSPAASTSLSTTPITPVSGSLPLTPVSASVSQPATPAVPATPAQPVSSTPTPTPTLTPAPIYNTPPVISSVSASSITSNSAVINWATDVPATGFVNYGSTPTNWRVSPENTSLTTQHSFIISNLAVNTLYTFRVYSHNAYGDQTDIVNGYPPNRTFTTLSGSVSCSSINLTLNDGKTTYVKGTDNLVNYTWTCSPGGSADVNVGIQKPTGWISLNTTTNSSTKTSSIDISGDNYSAGSYRLEACFGTCGSIVAGQTFTISSPSPTPVANDAPPAITVLSVKSSNELHPVTIYAGLQANLSISVTDDKGITFAGFNAPGMRYSSADVNSLYKCWSGATSCSDQYSLTPDQPGNYIITAKVTDTSGQTVIKTVTFNAAGCSSDLECGGSYFPSSGATFCGPSGASLYTQRLKYKVGAICQTGGSCNQSTAPGVYDDCGASGKICGFSPANGGQFQCVTSPDITCTSNAAITSSCLCGPSSYEQYGYCCKDSGGNLYHNVGACPSVSYNKSLAKPSFFGSIFKGFSKIFRR